MIELDRQPWRPPKQIQNKKTVPWLSSSRSDWRVLQRRCQLRGGAYSFVACLRHLTNDHASLSRRSTVPTPNRDTSNIRLLIAFSPHVLHILFLLILSPSCFAVCGYHLPPSIAVVFSLLSSVSNFSMSHSSFPSFSLTPPIPPCMFLILRPCEFYSVALPQGRICASSSSSRLLVYLFLISGRSRSPTPNPSFSFFA